MEATTLTAGEALAQIDDLLDRVDASRSGVAPATRLIWVRLARRVEDRASALASLLTAEAERAHASEVTNGTPLTTWLTTGEPLSRREASTAIHRARSIADHASVADAATAGRVNNGQARAIARVLDSLAPQLSPHQQSCAEDVLVDLAGRLDADQLARSSEQVLAAVAPADHNELLETRLQRQAEAAHRNRSLRFYREGASVRFDGSLPRIEAEKWISQLDAQREAQRRTALEARDPAAAASSPEQRRADALIALIDASSRVRPELGVGAAKVIVKLDFARLQADAAAAGTLNSGETLSAGELRRICCDAEIIPVTLGGPSEVLDVGRGARLVTPAIRTALVVRDGGCTFPGCDVLPNVCDAHHIDPWWAGGVTSLSNLTLLCHHHHGLVEPAKFGLRDQWQVRVARDGVPEFIPPARLDASHRPRRHRRFDPDGDADHLSDHPTATSRLLNSSCDRNTTTHGPSRNDSDDLAAAEQPPGTLARTVATRTARHIESRLPQRPATNQTAPPSLERSRS